MAVQSGTSVGMVQPAGANTYTARVTATQYSAGVMEVYVKVALQCDARTGGTFWIDSRMVNAGSWVNVSYPAMTLLPLPAQTQAVADTATRVKVVMLDGGARVRNGLAASIDAPRPRAPPRWTGSAAMMAAAPGARSAARSSSRATPVRSVRLSSAGCTPA
ncbi:hypothetical protein FSC37_16130 [Piscinibacter aquaticus]|uniref:Uncharacterized protein n=1 Tax=Piscinibacter aquaticus TaxID=392597 RepID=A0A5C6U158_9BURK|nr:hypothetical protein FSC37_16130 [Piscinibacter aquaticus]